MKLPFRDVQYVYTNQCGLANKTNYCTVPKNITQKANIEVIKRACDIFKEHNLQIKVLGGNPSDEEDFCQFIEYLNKKRIDYVVADNAINYEKLLGLNVKGVMFSLDTLYENNIGGCSYEKSLMSKKVIELYHDMFEYIGANIVINSLNYKEIPEIIEFLTENDVIANICPLIVGHNKDYIFRVGDSPYSLDKLNNRHEKIKELSNNLIEMKNSGFKIGVPIEYLEHLPDVIKKNYFDWNCYSINTIPILRVNTDLSLMVCSDIIGSMKKFSIFDINNKFSEINRAWINDKEKIRCCENNGCYWSNIVIADIYRRKGLGTLEATMRNL